MYSPTFADANAYVHVGPRPLRVLRVGSRLRHSPFNQMSPLPTIPPSSPLPPTPPQCRRRPSPPSAAASSQRPQFGVCANDNDDASNVTQSARPAWTECWRTGTGALTMNSTLGVHKARSPRRTRTGTSSFPTRTWAWTANGSIQSAVVGVNRVLPPPYDLEYTGGAATGAQAVAGVAPATTATPAQGAMSAAAGGSAGTEGSRVPVSFPLGHGCSSRLTRRPR